MIKIYTKPISKSDARQFLGKPFSDMIKFVADIKLGKLALGGELHADAEALLLDDGSAQSDLWGANYYPDKALEDQIEYTAMINIRPSQGNASMEVLDEKVKVQIRKLIQSFIV